MEFSFGKLVMIMFVVGVYVLAPLAGVYWLFSKTRMGKNLARRNEPGMGDLTLQVADQLRTLQSQLDDAHSRLDFAERVMLEQREQLRALGAPEPLTELREPTPV